MTIRFLTSAVVLSVLLVAGAVTGFVWPGFLRDPEPCSRPCDTLPCCHAPPGQIVIAQVDQGNDWPQYRGPNRDGVSQEKGLLKTWPKEGPKLLWTYKDGGLGFSNIVVVGKSAYLTGSRKDAEDVVIALNAETGKEEWTASIGPLFTFKSNTWGDGPRGTPTIDGNLLYAIGGDGDLVCLDRTAGGKEVWRKSLVKDLGGVMMTNWGFCESPLIDGDLLLCTPGGVNGTLAALDKKTGEVKWRSKELKNMAPYSSVVVAEIQGVRQYIVNSYVEGGAELGGYTSGVAAKDGTVLWTMQIFKSTSYAIGPTPIIKDNLVYVTSGYGGGCHLFAIDKKMNAKDLYAKKVQKNVKNTHGGVVLVGDHVYGHTEPGTWFSQDFKTGVISSDKDWRNSLECTSGSITAADGMLYLYADTGEAVLIEADPEKWNEKGRFTIPQKSAYPEKRPTSRASKVWSHPVIAHGRLFLRDCELVFCYDIRAGKK